MEEYVSSAALAETVCGDAYPQLNLRCVVVSTCPLRACEFSDDSVFTAMGSVEPARPGGPADSYASPVRVNFYGAWAMAASFMDAGDVIILQGFQRLQPPPAPYSSSGAGSTVAAVAVVCPLPEDGSAMRVLQPGKGGDVMEVVVAPPNLEAICMRGLSALDRVNHHYVRQCVEARAS